MGKGREDGVDEARQGPGLVLSLVPPAGLGDTWDMRGPPCGTAGGLSLYILCCRAAARQGAKERVPAGIFVGSRLSIKWNTVFITNSALVQ